MYTGCKIYMYNVNATPAVIQRSTYFIYNNMYYHTITQEAQSYANRAIVDGSSPAAKGLSSSDISHDKEQNAKNEVQVMPAFSKFTHVDEFVWQMLNMTSLILQLNLFGDDEYDVTNTTFHALVVEFEFTAKIQ